MNRLAKFISAALSLLLVGCVTVAMLVSGFAADTPKFSVSVVSETNDEVVIAFSLDEGAIKQFDIQINAVDWESETKTTGLTLYKIERSVNVRAYITAHADDVPPLFAIDKNAGKVAFASLAAYDTIGEILRFTFTKFNVGNVKASDFIAVVNSCTDDNNITSNNPIINNIPTSESASAGTPVTKKYGDNLSWTFDVNTGTLTIAGTGSMPSNTGSSSVPWSGICEKIKKVNISEGVTSISNSAFSGCVALTSVILPDSVKSIGNFAFRGCSNLSTVDLGQVKSLGYMIFDDCTSLTEITVPKTVSSCTEYISNYYSGRYYGPFKESSIKTATIESGMADVPANLFSNCKTLENVVIPDGATKIGQDAFYYCECLTSISIPDSVTSIDANAFYGCSGLTKVSLGKSVKSLGNYAFYGCSNLEYLQIPSTISFRNSYGAFFNCTHIEDIYIINGSGDIRNDSMYFWNNWDNSPFDSSPNARITFADDVEAIPGYMFSGCQFSSISLPSGLKYIGEYAFRSCSKLQSITIPDSVEIIADNAFLNCTGLKTVNLGNSRKLSINYNVFDGCNGIKSFTVGSASENYCTDDFGVLYNKNKSGLIKYPAASSLTSYTVNSATQYINDHAFENSKKLEKVTFPENMMSIGTSAFKNCTALKEAILSDGLITLCYGAFDGCTSIQKVVLPESLETLGGRSFRDCTNLTEVIFNCKDCADINNYRSPFENAGSKSGGFTLTFTDTVKSIPDYLFYNIYYYYLVYFVNEINIGANVATAGSNTFVSLKNLTTINYNAANCLYLSFWECENLTTINIGDDVKTIPAEFVYGCANVNDITIPQGVTRIGADAFTGTAFYENPDNWSGDELRVDNKLIRVKETFAGEYTFDPSVTVVADGAFKNCKITKVTIPSNIITLGYSCFGDIDELKEVNFNAVNCQFAESAFYGSGVEKFNIGNNVTKLPSWMLANCEALNELKIPKSVTTMGYDIFGYTQTTVHFLGNDRINIIDDSYIHFTSIIYCKQNSFVHSYLSMKAAPFYLFNDLNDDVFRVENDLLDSYTGSSEHVFVNFASKIGYGAFENNSTIKSVELSNSVTTIFNAAFKNCKELQTVIIPQNVSSIGDDAFDGCDKLTIWCYAGSYAESFAKSRGLNISLITLQISEQEINLRSYEACLLTASFNTVMDADSTITWSSDNLSVATVSSSGEIIAVGEGTARITAKSDTGLSATCLIRVSDIDKPSPKLDSVKIDDLTMDYKSSKTLTPEIVADDGAEYTITYSSDSKNVTVDENGKIYGAKRGSANITVTVTDSQGNVFTDTCKVEVKYTWWQWIIKIVLFGWIWY